MLVAFARYSRDASFTVPAQQRGFVLTMAAASVAGTVLGGVLLGVVPGAILIPVLVALMRGVIPRVATPILPGHNQAGAVGE
jgi:uncharacterized protein